MKETPYQLTVSQLHDALGHIAHMARASRTQTHRLRRIAMRAEAALEGREFDSKEAFSIPMKIRGPASYEIEIRELKRERDNLLAQLDKQ